MTTYKNLAEMIDECYPRWRNMPPREIFEEVARETIKAITPGYMVTPQYSALPPELEKIYNDAIDDMAKKSKAWLGIEKEDGE